MPEQGRDVPAPRGGVRVTALVRRLGLVLPTEAASAPAWRGHPPAGVLREVLGGPLDGRLAAAVEHQDDARVDAHLRVLLADPYLGPRIRRLVGEDFGHALATAYEGATP